MRLNRRKSQPLNLTASIGGLGDLAASGQNPVDPAEPDEATASSPFDELPELPRVARLGPNFPPPSSPLPGLDAAPSRPDGGAGAQAYLIAGVGAVLWAGCFTAFVLGFQGRVTPVTYPPFAAVMLAMLTILPGGAMVMAAYAVRQASRLAAETRRAHALADALALPVSLAADRTGDLMALMREAVEQASAAAASAHDRLITLQEALAAQTGRLGEVAEASQRSAQAVGETLERERERTSALAATLQTHAAELSQAVDGQTRLVAEASDLARSQLQEAEATLAARAADVTAAAATAAAAAQQAGEHLLEQTGVLDAAGGAMTERMAALDRQLAEHYAAMTSLLNRCSQADDDAAVRLETRRAQLVEAIAQARIGEAELGDASTHSADLLQGLIAAASDQVRDLVATIQAEQAGLSQRAEQARGEAQADLDRAIGALGETAQTAFQRVAAQAEEIRRASDSHVQAAKAEVEQLGEVAYEAGRRANQAFDTRVGEARRLIEQAGTLVEEAGQRSAARIEASLRDAAQTVARLSDAFTDMDARMAGLPEQTRARVEAMRAATDRGVVELGEAMRRLTEQTQSIDAAFQDRVRRNGQALQDAAGDVVQPAAAPQSSTTTPSALAAPTTPESRLQDEMPDPAADFDDDFVEPETLFERDARPQPSNRSGNGARDRKPVFSGGRAPAPQVFGRAGARTERDDDPLLDTPLVQRGRFADEHPGDGPPASERHSNERQSNERQANGRAPDDAQPDPDPPSTATGGSGGAGSRPTGARPEQDRLRPRLRLTPTEADRVLKTVFDPVQAAERDGKATAAAVTTPGRAWEQDLDEWTWKDLLSSIDEPPAGEDRLAEQMIGEIAALGVDAAALLPRTRLEEIAACVRAGDPLAARESVRRLAPAAVRRLSRRVLVDKALREQADRYVRHYEGLLRASNGPDDDRASTLLSSDPGRAYLLLDAAVGDLR